MFESSADSSYGESLFLSAMTEEALSQVHTLLALDWYFGSSGIALSGVDNTRIA